MEPIDIMLKQGIATFLLLNTHEFKEKEKEKEKDNDPPHKITSGPRNFSLIYFINKGNLHHVFACHVSIKQPLSTY